jgi:hypothetical protein
MPNQGRWANVAHMGHGCPFLRRRNTAVGHSATAYRGECVTLAMRTPIAVLILVAALAACGTETGPPSAPRSTTTGEPHAQVRDYFSPPKPFPGPTWTRQGHSVDGKELNSIAGPAHCGWQSAVLLHLGWPPGTVSKTITNVHQYVRDPKGVLGRGLRNGLRQHVRMPKDATDTGYRTGSLHLWLSHSDPEGAYLRVGNDVERWPRADTPLACM